MEETWGWGRLGGAPVGVLALRYPGPWPTGSVQDFCGHLPFRYNDQLQLAAGRSCVPDLPLSLHIAQHEEGLLAAGSRCLG